LVEELLWSDYKEGDFPVTASIQLPVQCLRVKFRVPEESKIDDAGTYAEYCDWTRDILPFIATRVTSIDNLILASSAAMRLQKEKLVKTADSVEIVGETAVVTQFDLHDPKFTDFLFLYFAHPGWLNGFVQSSDLGFLRDFLNLFPPVYRKGIAPTRDPSDLLPEVFGRGRWGRFIERKSQHIHPEESRHWRTLMHILSRISGSTFLISTLDEGTVNESAFGSLRSDGVLL